MSIPLYTYIQVNYSLRYNYTACLAEHIIEYIHYYQEYKIIDIHQYHSQRPIPINFSNPSNSFTSYRSWRDHNRKPLSKTKQGTIKSIL